MKVLFLGDVVGPQGCQFIRTAMSELKKQYTPDLIIANGENSAQGNGILPSSANYLFDSGVDVITTGNHALKRHEIYSMLEEDLPLIRPANYHPLAAGRGVTEVDKLRYRVAVVNLMGVAFMEPLKNPFDVIDDLLADIDANIVILDFHAEATAEKLAMGFYLDGRVSLVVGTHTHVQTADERILPKGTGYITDLGMCGGLNSVLGVKPNLAIARLQTQLPTRFVNDEGLQCICGILAEIDEKTGKCIHIERVRFEETEELYKRRAKK